MSSGNFLESLFFLQEEKKLTENLQKMKALKETKEAISKVSGIKDDKILQKLVDLDIRPEIAASLTLIPLVAVAWADGEIDEKEKATILTGASKLISGDNQINHEVLKTWLSRKPGPELLEAWKHYVAELCGRLNETERNRMRDAVLGHAVKVAKSSGGIFGIGAISFEEQEMINLLKKAFSVSKS
jgi:tellurite resistance protein